MSVETKKDPKHEYKIAVTEYTSILQQINQASAQKKGIEGQISKLEVQGINLEGQMSALETVFGFDRDAVKREAASPVLEVEKKEAVKSK